MLSDSVALVTATADRLLQSAMPPNEADTRAFLIDPMLESLGWRLSDPEHVRREYTVYGGACLDYALLVNERPALFVEAKALGKNLESPAFISQVLNYGNNEGVPWCVLTDGMIWAIYRANAPVRAPDKLVARIDLRDPESSAAIRGLERTAVEFGAIEDWASQWRTAAQRASTPAVTLSDSASKNSEGNFDQRLRHAEPAAVMAAEKLAGWALSHGWRMQTRGETSRLFLPPVTERNETGLRLHFESFDREPALEFDLVTLRRQGASSDADAIHALLSEFEGRKLAAKFPSLSCLVIATRWDDVRAGVLDRYVSARSATSHDVNRRE